MFTDEEAFALILGLRGLRHLGLAPFAPAMEGEARTLGDLDFGGLPDSRLYGSPHSAYRSVPLPFARSQRRQLDSPPAGASELSDLFQLVNALIWPVLLGASCSRTSTLQVLPQAFACGGMPATQGGAPTRCSIIQQILRRGCWFQCAEHGSVQHQHGEPGCGECSLGAV